LTQTRQLGKTRRSCGRHVSPSDGSRWPRACAGRHRAGQQRRARAARRRCSAAALPTRMRHGSPKVGECG
jgi:hypothetical protein